MSAFEGAGWRVGATSLYVGRVPYRRGVAVYTVDGNVVRVLAYCRSEAEATRLIAVVDTLTR